MVPLAETVLQSKPNEMRAELLAEQRRLAKLWDAFKKQEDEYRSLEKERDELWTRVQELEKTVSAFGPQPHRTVAKLDHLEKENDRLRRDVSELGARHEQNHTAFIQEQQRLAKLYRLYEDAEGDIERQRKDLEKARRQLAKPVKAPKVTVRHLGLPDRKRLYKAELAALKERARKTPGGQGPIEARPAALALKKRYAIE